MKAFLYQTRIIMKDWTWLKILICMSHEMPVAGTDQVCSRTEHCNVRDQLGHARLQLPGHQQLLPHA